MTTIRKYILGFGLSVALTLTAFWAATQSGPKEFIIASLVALAVAQLFVQLICFLHLDEEGKPRWNFITFLFTAFVVIVLVGGSIWIMYHLEHNMTDDTSEIW